ncbi:branched-chain amino acid ABC transporter substrate-binding protein [uncultured Chryseobacterium sp.]|uniref:branched-chain amino acid ABC transporter substrate-binding protein n=1 Tax=uncultured Chryseobacterium sp. TaxID=259322 RepID=UPI0025FA78DE|nr:branched-chain amino acid ABC transporter substrate-binding protein [uncultured Chryseobacterium sp.]
MPFNLFDALGFFSDCLNLLDGVSSSGPVRDEEYPEKKPRYFKEIMSVLFILISVVLIVLVFTDPSPKIYSIRALVMISLIGIAVSCTVFFILYLMGRYYFTSVFQWLLFSGSMMLFFISLGFCLYFKSGWFLQ